jgi:MFS family permease
MNGSAETAADSSVRSRWLGIGKACGPWATVGLVLLGNMVSVNTLLTYTMGVFIGTFNHDLGWSRADIALSMTCYTIVAFLGTGLIGRLADHLNPGRIAAISTFAFGLSLILAPRFIHDVQSLWIAYIFLALVGLGTSPAVFTKPVIAAFSKWRGIAIGVSLTGVGIGGFLAPRFAAALIERGDWKSAYVGMGCSAIVVAPILWFVLGPRARIVARTGHASLSSLPGVELRVALRSRAFWLLTAIALFSGLGGAGAAMNVIPLLRDYAVTPVAAASLASTLGLGSISGRLTSGYVLDRINGPAVGFPFLLTGSLGIALLLLLDVHAAIAGIFLLGFAIGSECDLLAYFTSRYFGLRAHATIFGCTYGVIALGASIAPVVVGALRDRQGDYVLGFTLSALALVAAACVCLLLGKYRYPAQMGAAD